MIRHTFLSFEKMKKLGEEGISNIYKFLCGWLCSQNISNITRKCERFFMVSFFLKILKLCLTQVIVSLRQQVSTVNISFQTLYNYVQLCATLYNSVLWRNARDAIVLVKIVS